MKKRILSIVLAIAMAATLAPVSGLVSSKEAQAATVSDVPVYHASGNLNVRFTRGGANVGDISSVDSNEINITVPEGVQSTFAVSIAGPDASAAAAGCTCSALNDAVNSLDTLVNTRGINATFATGQSDLIINTLVGCGTSASFRLGFSTGTAGCPLGHGTMRQYITVNVDVEPMTGKEYFMGTPVAPVTSLMLEAPDGDAVAGSNTAPIDLYRRNGLNQLEPVPPVAFTGFGVLRLAHVLAEGSRNPASDGLTITRTFTNANGATTGAAGAMTVAPILVGGKAFIKAGTYQYTYNLVDDRNDADATNDIYIDTYTVTVRITGSDLNQINLLSGQSGVSVVPSTVNNYTYDVYIPVGTQGVILGASPQYVGATYALNSTAAGAPLNDLRPVVTATSGVTVVDITGANDGGAMLVNVADTALENTTVPVGIYAVEMTLDTEVNVKKVRLFIGSRPAPAPPAPTPEDREVGVTLNGTSYEYGQTITASYTRNNNPTYRWQVAVFPMNSTTTPVGNSLTVLKQSTLGTAAGQDRNADKLTISDLNDSYTTTPNYTWNFNDTYEIQRVGRSDKLVQVRRIMVRAEVVGTDFASRWVEVKNHVLKDRDFMYGSGAASRMTWRDDWAAWANSPDGYDRGFTGEGAKEGELRLRSDLFDADYTFTVLYREADQAEDVLGLGAQANIGTATKFVYPPAVDQGAWVRPFYTFDEIPHAGTYKAYVVDINHDKMPNTNVLIPNYTMDTVFNGQGPWVSSDVNVNPQKFDAYELETNDRYRADANVGAPDDSLGVPAVCIGTLYVERGKNPDGAVIIGEDPTDNFTGYVVDSRLIIESVNVDNVTRNYNVNNLSEVQWYRVTKDQKTWTPIEGATGNTYTIGVADIGYLIGVEVGHYNYAGAIRGNTQTECGKRIVDVNFNTGGKYRQGHFTESGSWKLDLRPELSVFGKGEADVDFNISGHGTFASGKYNAADNSLVFNFRPIIPQSFIPYLVDTTIEFPGYKVNLEGYVEGTLSDVPEVIIEPVDGGVYDGKVRTATAKAYVNGVEVPDAVINYTFRDNTRNINNATPMNAGSYTATATWSTNGAFSSTNFTIAPKKLVPQNVVPTEYAVGAETPIDRAWNYGALSKDSVRVRHAVREFRFADAWNVNNWEPIISKVFYTPTMDIGGTFYIHFIKELDPEGNYAAPDPIKITVGTGKIDTDPTNPGVTPSTPTEKDPLDDHFVEGGVYRLYSPVTGEHLFTTDFREYKALANGKSDPASKWQAEKASFITAKADDKDAVAVRRFYNANGEGHVYTFDKREINALTADPNWSDDNDGKAAFYVLKANTDTEGAVDVYRIYNPADGQHLMTADKREVNYNVTEKGWMYDSNDGTGLYCKMIPVPSSK